MDINADIHTRAFSEEDFEDFLALILSEITNKNFRITKVLNIDNIEKRENLKKDLDIGFKHYKIIEFCNLFICNDIISPDLRAGVFMPQKFTVYQPLDEKKIYISFLKPVAIARMFGHERMMKASLLLENQMTEILDELEK